MIGKAAGFNYISVEYLLWLRSLRELRPPIEGLSACVLGGWEKDSSYVVHTYPRVSLQEMPSAAPAPLHSGAPGEVRGGSTE